VAVSAPVRSVIQWNRIDQRAAPNWATTSRRPDWAVPVTHRGGTSAEAPNGRKIKPFPSPHIRGGAAWANVWANLGITTFDWRLSLYRRGFARRHRSDFLSRLELGHLALKFGREILKDPQLLRPTLH
jgi:hypothetical protein